METKPLSFEQLTELQEIDKSDIAWKVEQFIDDLKVSIGVTISYKDEIIYQREVKDNILITKTVRFYKKTIPNKPN